MKTIQKIENSTTKIILESNTVFIVTKISIDGMTKIESKDIKSALDNFARLAEMYQVEGEQ